jgi:hypothetical protein
VAILEGFSETPPPPQLKALLERVFSGRGLYLYVRSQYTTDSLEEIGLKVNEMRLHLRRSGLSDSTFLLLISDNQTTRRAYKPAKKT